MENTRLLIQEIIVILQQYIDLAERASHRTDPAISENSVELLTIKECTELVNGLSQHTVRKWVAEGKVICIRAGEGKRGKILILKSSFLDCVKGVA